MTSVLKFPEQNRIDEEAATWVARLDGGSMSSEDLRALRRWSRQSSKHRLTLERLASSWDRLDVLGLIRDEEPVARMPGRRFTKIAAGLAAGLAVLALSINILSTPGPDVSAPPPVAKLTYSTPIGELDSVTLPDGSMIRLNTDTRLQVEYSDNARNIFLEQGEAFFSVAKSSRPFVVNAGTRQVAALGTAFAVRLSPNNVVEVDVIEGTVSLTADAGQAGSAATAGVQARKISAGDQGRIDGTIEITTTTDVRHLEQKLSWRGGVLDFDGYPLEKVVAELARYTATEIVISDSQLRNLVVGGHYTIGETDVEVYLETLESRFNIETDRVREDLIYLRIR